MSQVKLTADQMTANRKAIHSYIIDRVKANGGVKNQPVVLIPEFEEDQETGEWYPTVSNGVRATKKEGFSFMRLGTAFINDNMEVAFRTTNQFNDEEKLLNALNLMDVTVGDAIPGKVLVVEESLTAFRKTNGEQDIKYAGTSGIPCMVDDQPIYRRVKLATAGTQDTLIAHTNKEQISKHQAAEWAKNNQPQTAGIKGAAANKLRK